MAIYVKPGAYSRFTETAGSVNLGSGTRILAIIGTSLTYKTAVETLQRASYPTDDLSDALVNENVTEITSVGDFAYTSDYIEDTDFQLINDEIVWMPGGTRPAADAKYYVRYNYSKSGTDYDAKLLYSRKEAKVEYGEEVSNNNLAIASNIYFDNGPAPIIIVQTDGTTTQAYKDAIDKLKYEIEGADPTHLIALTTSATIQSYLYTHCLSMSSMFQRKERRTIISTDINTAEGDMKSKAEAFASERMVYPPQWATREIKNTSGTYQDFTLDGTYVACGVTGMLLNRNIEESITNEVLSGFKKLGKDYLEEEADALAEKGILVLYTKGGIIKVRHDITTSVATPEENQWSVSEIKDYVIKNVRDVLEKQWLAKPIYGLQTVENVSSTAKAVLDKLIEAKIITDYNGVSAEQNSGDSRRIDVEFNFKPVYPLMWIYIDFGFIKS
jgi:hypothetical protein